MATVKKNRFRSRQFGGAAAAYGNAIVFHYQLKTASNGGAVDANSTAPLAVGDVVDLGPLPAGMRLDDCLVIVSAGLTAAVAGSLGFAYEDDVNDAKVPQDDAYFGSELDLATAARLRSASTKAPVVLPKPARLILTVAGAANAQAGQIDVVVHGELTGNR